MRYLFFCLIILFNFSLFAQEPAVVEETASKVADDTLVPIQKSLLWKIEGKDLKKDSYLFGTIHMIPSNSFFWPPNTKEAVKACERMTFEINMDDMTNIGSQMSMMMNLFMKNGMTLPKLISEDDYKLVRDHFDEIDMPLPSFMIDKIKPMFLSIMATTDMDMMGGGLMEAEESKEEEKVDEGIKSYEMEFMTLANEADMLMDGLETVEYQMSMFDSIPYKDQAMMLVDAIKMEQDTSASKDGSLEHLVELYIQQDLVALQTSIQEETSGVGEFEDLLLIQRNKNWIPLMEDQMKDKPTFFAVGAGHLGGKEGVIALLRAQGYTLTPASIYEEDVEKSKE